MLDAEAFKTLIQAAVAENQRSSAGKSQGRAKEGANIGKRCAGMVGPSAATKGKDPQATAKAGVAKDKPVLCTALACADVLLTLDRRDFQSLLGKSVYDLRVLTPGEFLDTERKAGRL